MLFELGIEVHVAQTGLNDLRSEGRQSASFLLPTGVASLTHDVPILLCERANGRLSAQRFEPSSKEETTDHAAR